jgi:serine/threonine protein kinase
MASTGTSKLPAPFGKYLLSRLIAVGGMAEVYRAKIFGASGFEKDMVVKRILPKYAQNPNFVQMLIDEAKIAVSLSHGNIVPIYELGEFEGSYYIAMEYVEGRTVLDVLRDAHSKKHPLPWPYCLGVAADVAKGLAYAHGRTDAQGKSLGLVHRDINPRNIVITPAGEVKILDFGIARASTKRHQTASGVIKGTPGYMSPEQMYGHTVDSRSDIYCLGILVYELLTLRRLFPVWDVNEMRAVFEAGPIPLPSSIAKHVSRDVDAVIMKALTQDISQRYQSAADFEEALRTVIARSGTAVTSAGLAREIQAIDDAPGPRAPRTAPPVVESQAARQQADAGQMTPGARSAPVDAPLSPTRPVTPKSNPSQRSPAPVVVPVPQAPPRHEPIKTQPMPIPSAPAADLDAAHSFVISLADGKPGETRPTAPLPQVSADDIEKGHRTQVFVQNRAVEWAAEIGADAELLALMKATGAHPSAGRRTVLIAAGVGVVVVGLVLAAFGNDIVKTVKRAMSGQKAELGAVIVKTIPSGADVNLDGKNKGKTNLKVAGVDINEPHRLVVTPKGKDPIIVELVRADFKEGEDGVQTYLFERDLSPPKDPEPTPAK